MTLVAVAALFGFAATTATADVVPVPVGNAGSALTSIACPGSGDCVAVGSYTANSGDTQILIETESSGVWSADALDLSKLTTVAADAIAQLNSVSCTTVADCVAVGSYFDPSGSQGLVATESNGVWSAAKLNLSSLPNVASVPDVELTSVSCPSAGNCSAVGEYADAAGNQQGLLASERNGVWTAQEADVTALDGASQPFTILNQVSCASAGNCAAVGSYADAVGNTLGLIATESGGTWSVQGPDFSDLPSVAAWGTQDIVLQAVSCPSTGDCAAVGTYIDGSPNGGSLQGMLLSESNGAWSQATEASLPGDAFTTGSSGLFAQPDLVLNSVSCASAGNCTAVGAYDSTSADNVDGFELTETGGNWGAAVTASLPLVAAGNPEAALNSVSCTAPGTCVAAGTYDLSDGNNAVLIARQSAGTWSADAVEQTSSSYSYYLANAASVSCATDGYCATTGFTQNSLQQNLAFLLDAPGTAGTLRATASGKRAVDLAWTVPGGDTFDPPVSSYTIVVHDLTNPSRDKTITWTGGTAVAVSGLRPGNTYTFTVDDTSILGTGVGATSGSVALGLTRRQIAASLARLLRPKGPASRLARLRRSHIYVFTYRPLESGKVSVRWYEKLGHGKHSKHLVASGSVVANGTRAMKLRVRLTARGRQAVGSAAGKLRLTATVTFRTGSTTVTKTRSFTLH